jgi:hypothetical protein
MQPLSRRCQPPSRICWLLSLFRHVVICRRLEENPTALLIYSPAGQQDTSSAAFARWQWSMQGMNLLNYFFALLLVSGSGTGYSKQIAACTRCVSQCVRICGADLGVFGPTNLLLGYLGTVGLPAARFWRLLVLIGLTSSIVWQFSSAPYDNTASCVSAGAGRVVSPFGC